LKSRDVERIADRLRQRDQERQRDMTRERMHDLARESFRAAREMVRYRVSSETAAGAVCAAWKMHTRPGNGDAPLFVHEKCQAR
jgi:hypothetical protein